MGTWTHTWPADGSARQELRDANAERLRRRAEREAAIYGLSMRCEIGDHGCRNDGTGCLCRCHDDKGTQ